MSDKRSIMMPDIPTVAEAGVPGCEAELWTAIVVPAGVPREIINRLNETLNGVVNSPEVQEALKVQGVDPEPGPPEVVTAVIKADILKWRDIVVTAKIAEPNQ
jgi:tripartite-type tricarboxylate transporter receptor subunit TctC